MMNRLSRRQFVSSIAGTTVGMVATASPSFAAKQTGPAGALGRRIIERFQTLPGEHALYILSPKPGQDFEVSLNPDAQLFCASAFKGFVLAEYLRMVDKGEADLGEPLCVDPSIWSPGAPVLTPFPGRDEVTCGPDVSPEGVIGTINARTALDAMISRSDNTATDIMLRHVGADRVRQFIDSIGLKHTQIPDRTRRFFAYIVGAPNWEDISWDELVDLLESDAPPQHPPILNPVQTMAVSPRDFVSFYSRALQGEFFNNPGVLTIFRAVLSQSEAIPRAIPLGMNAFIKGGSIDFDGARAVAGGRRVHSRTAMGLLWHDHQLDRSRGRAPGGPAVRRRHWRDLQASSGAARDLLRADTPARGAIVPRRRGIFFRAPPGARPEGSMGPRAKGFLVPGAALALLLLSAAPPAVAQGVPAGTAPVRYKVGVFVTDLHGFDLARGAFGANFWVWSIGPDAERALRTMEFPNAASVTVQVEGTLARGAIAWSQRKVTGTFRAPWDLRDFPFDRHVLEIVLEEGVEEENALIYEPDAANSGHTLREAIEGWRVRGMRVETRSAAYATSFGDPAATRPASQFTRLQVALALERAEWTGFAKLTAALYAGFLICAVGSLVPVTATTFAPRVTLLSASLFAIVVNMRAASAALGSEHGLTLVDRLHVAGLAYVVAVSAVTVLVRRRLERGERGDIHPAALVRLDHCVCAAAAALFIAANAALMARAALAGGGSP